MPEPLLVVDDVRKQYGGLRAVDGVGFSVPAGKTVALIGPNGAGKTTMFNCIAGSERVTSGRISFDGRDVTRLPAYKRAALGMARSFQHLGLSTEESVLFNVAACLHTQARYGIAGSLLGSPRRRRSEAALLKEARFWIDRVGLSQHADRPVSSLSFGMARRAEIAGVLALRPKLLLLDEPTAGLTVAASQDLFELLQGIREEFEVTVLIIGHDLGFVMSIAEEVFVMAQGRLLAQGSPAEVQRHPAVIEAYLGRASTVEAEEETGS